MKKLVLLLLLSIGISYVHADSFKVLFVNDTSLKYTNGKAVKVGDTFKSAEDINWQKDKQAIKVFDLTTKKQMIFLGKEWKRKSGFDALISQKRLSTNEVAGLPEDQKDPFMDIFEDEYLLLDPIEIPVKESIVLDENNLFEVTYDYGDTRLTKPLKQKGHSVILDKSLFTVDGKELEPRDITISIDYISADSPIPTLAKDKIVVTYIPDVLK
jgi:hypothetical protein